jgi:hypothetical protein
MLFMMNKIIVIDVLVGLLIMILVYKIGWSVCVWCDVLLYWLFLILDKINISKWLVKIDK